jgi:aldehyde:ferredoxin oxidoreductase
MRVSAAAIANAVGWEDFDAEEAYRVGHRSVTLERIFNMQHGLTADDDIKVAPRIVETAPADAGPAAGLFAGRYVEGWIRDYYEHLGWDRRFGKPWLKTLKKLGLEEFVPLVWGETTRQLTHT